MIENIIIYSVLFFIGLITLEQVGTLKNASTKKVLVILISVLLIAWLDIFSLLLLTVYSTFILYVIKQKKKWFDNILYFVIFNILLLIFIKDYYLFFDLKTIYVPLGVSYYFFRLIALVIEYRKHKVHYENMQLLDYYTYVFFFPIFPAGPIQRFRDFYLLENSLSLKERQKTYLLLFFVIFLKLAVVDTLLYPFAYDTMYHAVIQDLKSHTIDHKIFIFGFSAFIHAYLDLMLYTEISKAIALILGFTKCENFNKPLLATNISQFWQSWHMSLSNWTRDYVFFPTLIKTKKVWVSTYASMLVIGIWHSISFNWIFWAFMHGSALNFYLWLRNTDLFKILINYRISKIFLLISGNILTIAFVSSVFIIVAIHDKDVMLQLGQTILHLIKLSLL
jgi:alginate O-acetyltransferase complex protein AlgI